jgi:hypothetical protein
MRKSSFIAVLALGLAATAFAGDQVTTQAAQDANFTQCTSYQWAKTGQEIPNPITAANVVSEIDAQLAAKGWKKSPTGACFVSYQCAVQQQRGANWSGMGGFGRFGGGMGDVQTYTIEQGELIVSIFDPAKKMIWMGSAKGTVNSDPNKESKNIQGDLKKMFQKFPTGK